MVALALQVMLGARIAQSRVAVDRSGPERAVRRPQVVLSSQNRIARRVRSSVEPEGPGLDRVYAEVRLAPRISGQRGSHNVLRIRRNHMHVPLLVLEGPPSGMKPSDTSPSMKAAWARQSDDDTKEKTSTRFATRCRPRRRGSQRPGSAQLRSGRAGGMFIGSVGSHPLASTSSRTWTML